MGLGGISIWQLLIILAIVVLLFGTKKLRGIGGDLGGALKSFKKAMASDDDDKNAKDSEGEVKQVDADQLKEDLSQTEKSADKVK